jgi:hypothetical protein
MVSTATFDNLPKSPLHILVKIVSALASVGGFVVAILVLPGFRWTLWVNDELLAHHIHLEEIKSEQARDLTSQLAVRVTLDDIKAQIQTRHLDLVQRLTRVETALEKK